jgi:threonine dehydrogenase-like Zn-dependent dehydrogenase
VGLWGIGGLGTHAVQIARIAGAAPIIAVDPLESARQRALKLGADAAIDPASGDVKERIMSLTGSLGLEGGADLVGSNAVLAEATGCLGQRGRCVMVGLSMEKIELERSLVFGVMRHAVLGHLGYSKRHMDELMRLVSTGRIDLTSSISDVLPLDEIAAGVDRLARKDGDPVRILVSP